MHKHIVAFREKYKDDFYALFRIVFGLLFFFHGLQKLGVFSGSFALPGSTLFAVAAVLESVGGLLLMLGLFTNYTAFVLAGEMAFAYFIGHVSANWALVWNPIVNKGEAPVLFCFAFLYIFASGPGKWSLDKKLYRGSR